MGSFQRAADGANAVVEWQGNGLRRATERLGRALGK